MISIILNWIIILGNLHIILLNGQIFLKMSVHVSDFCGFFSSLQQPGLYNNPK